MVRTTWTSCLGFALWWMGWTVTPLSPHKLAIGLCNPEHLFFISHVDDATLWRQNARSRSSFSSLQSGLNDRNCCVITWTCACFLPGCCLWISRQMGKKNQNHNKNIFCLRLYGHDLTPFSFKVYFNLICWPSTVVGKVVWFMKHEELLTCLSLSMMVS